MSDEPLLMLCGLGSDADGWRDQQRSLGGRALVARGETIAEMAAGILAVAPERFALAGHSMGGYVALEMIRVAPARVARLALLDTSAAPDTPAQTKSRKAAIAAIEKHGLEGLIDALTAGVTPDPALRERLATMFRRAGDARVIREQRACAARADARPWLGDIKVPTLVIGNTTDTIIPPGSAAALAAAIDGARLAMFDGGGHVTPMALPDAVTQEMAAWLKA